MHHRDHLSSCPHPFPRFRWSWDKPSAGTSWHRPSASILYLSVASPLTPTFVFSRNFHSSVANTKPHPPLLSLPSLSGLDQFERCTRSSRDTRQSATRTRARSRTGIRSSTLATRWQARRSASPSAAPTASPHPRLPHPALLLPGMFSSLCLLVCIRVYIFLCQRPSRPQISIRCPGGRVGRVHSRWSARPRNQTRGCGCSCQRRRPRQPSRPRHILSVCSAGGATTKILHSVGMNLSNPNSPDPRNLPRCQHCAKTFTSARGVKTHTRQVHELKKYPDWQPERQVACDRVNPGCETYHAFPFPDNYYDVGMDSERILRCPDCDKSFADDIALWQHTIAVHAFDDNDTRLDCSELTCMSAQLGDLLLHPIQTARPADSS